MPESRRYYALKNIRYGLINKILTLVLAFISRTVFIWGLGTSILGINAVLTDVLKMLSMVDLGFGIAMVYSFYEPIANHDYAKISGLITFYRKVYIILAVAVGIIGVALVPILPYIIKLDSAIPNIEIYYLLALLNVVFSYIYVYKTSILIADQKNYIVTKVSFITSIVRAIIQIFCILIFKSYFGYLVIGAGVTLANNLITSNIAEKRYPYIKNRVVLSTFEKKGIYRNLISVFLYKLSNVLLNATDNVLISIIVGTLAVGYYSNYFLIQSNIIAFYALLFTSITASVGNLIVKEKPEKRYEIFSIQQTMGFIFAGIIVPCYVVMINEFITIWLGRKFIFDIVTVMAIGLNTYLSCILQPLWTFREATGLYQKTKWIMILCAILNIVLSILLGKIVGLVGIIFASAISRLSTYIWYEPKLLFKEYFDQNVSKYYMQLLVNFIIVMLITTICFVFSQSYPVSGLLKWMFKTVSVFIICCIMTFFAYRKSSVISMVTAFLKIRCNR